MANRREERERLRQQRLAAQTGDQASARRRLIAGYVVAGVLAAAVVAGLVAVIASGGDGDGGGDAPGEAHVQGTSGVTTGLEFDEREGTEPPEIQFGDLEESAAEAGCELRLDLTDEGNNHFTDETQGTYQTNPPTSGNHYGTPNEAGSGAIADGAYTNAPPASRTVHSLEHGRVIIRYRPNLPEEQQLALKGVFEEDPDGMLLFPDPSIPYQVAIAAWTNLAGCKQYDPLVLDVIRNFRDTFRGNGPEPVPIVL